MKKRTIIIRQGPVLPPVMRGVCAFFGILGAISVIGIPLAIIFLGAFTYSGGTEIDPERGRLREYTASLGLRWGKWLSLESQAAIVLLRKTRVSTTYSLANQGADRAEANHDVVFVDRTHRKKFLVKACDTREEALALADQLAKITGKPIERYAPQRISARR